MIRFDNDYMAGCHPKILEQLSLTNLEETPGYGHDHYCKEASELIRKECGNPDAEVWFMNGGTQTNSTVLNALLRRHEGVIATESGHIAVHEAGAVEAWGHKVIELPSTDGKLYASAIDRYITDFYADATYPHMVFPGAVYISFPTELGTLYSLKELTDISEVCHKHNIPLFIDGARLGYGLMAESCDVTIQDIARLSDVFYIGGTKVGLLFGEAVVAKSPKLLPHFFTTIKQHGALLAKGRLLGIQFKTLFTDGLYYEVSQHAIHQANRIREAFTQNGYKIAFDSPTNQQFFTLPNEAMDRLAENVSFEVWGRRRETETTVRFVTSWSTKTEDVDCLIQQINKLNNK